MQFTRHLNPNPASAERRAEIMANDGHLAELSRKARAEMAEPSRG